MAIRYKFDELSSGQEDMNAGATRLDDILNNLEGQIGPLIERFVGDSATAYYAAQHRWDSQATDLNNLFVRGSSQVGASAESMYNQDRTTSGLFH